MSWQHDQQAEAIGSRILLADDSRESRLLVSAILQGTPHTLHPARNGQEAVDLFTTTSFDLVIMDVIMPEMDGYEATRLMRAIEARDNRPHTPIVAMTSFTAQDDHGRILAAGCDLCLAKPIQKNQLLKLIDRFYKHGTGTNSKHGTGTSSQPGHTDPEEKNPPADPVPESADPFPMPLPSLKAIDQQKIAHLRHNLRHHVTPLLQEYLLSLPASLQTIARSLTQRDARALFTAAHNLKGAAALIGADRLEHLAAELETAACQDDKDLAEKTKFLPALQDEVKRVLDEVREILNRHTDTLQPPF
ncbi:MAG: response regulator [Magnetococcales bacterium]|nr:response regulator [Magnetococcales bacterium]